MSKTQASSALFFSLLPLDIIGTFPVSLSTHAGCLTLGRKLLNNNIQKQVLAYVQTPATPSFLHLINLVCF